MVTVMASRVNKGFGANTATGTAIVVTSQLSHQFGAGFAVLLFPLVGALGTVSLRLAISTLLLAVILRPRIFGLSADAYKNAILFGVFLGAMNTSIYFAFDRIPLGTAVTIEMLGPLLLTVVLARKLALWLLASIAFIGVALLGINVGSQFDLLGVLFAALAGTFWAFTIVFSWRTARIFKGADGLILAMLVASLFVVPLGLINGGANLFSPKVLALGTVVAVLSSAVPYVLEQVALRRLATAQFAMLMSLAPALAAIAGVIVLGQNLSALEVIGIALVVLATGAAMRINPA